MRDDLFSVGFMTFTAVIMLFAGCVSGYRDGAASVRREAVQAGVAKWEADETGSASFTWTRPQ